MSQNPINLAVRFLLEIIALVAIGALAKAQFPGALGFILMIALPLFAAVVWGTFNVKGDPSRSGKAPVPVPGIVRLLIELDIFGCATWALFSLNPASGWIFGLVTLAHYILSYDRIAWLLKR
ncbi:MAG: YrdB family protein [Anaerolineales bacterium]|nr:YrdB family protein [Anaerolineales bacterium]